MSEGAATEVHAAPHVVPGREPPTAAIERLRADPQAFGFFQAVRLIYVAHGFDARGTAARPGPLRFATQASLNFPPAELDTLEGDSDGGWRMSVRFFGLTGPSGVLPRHYTEWLIARRQRRDRAAQDFLDLFNHRLITLFWRAWAKYRPDIGQEFGFPNSPLRYIHHLVGLGTPALQARLRASAGASRRQPGMPTPAPADPARGPGGAETPSDPGPPSARRGSERPLPGAALAYYAGLISQRPHGAGALSQVVGDVVGAPVAVDGCLGTWQRVPAADRTRLARASARLGDGCLLGGRYWDRQTTLRLCIGPLDRARFRGLLPRGDPGSNGGRTLLPDVVELTRFLTGLALDLHVKLALRADAVPPLAIGDRGRDRPRLGWNTWLSGRRSARPADECELHFSAMGGQSWR
ncbi:type VI secretion system baseplate subunit TssG [Luteimonas sp. SJ-92]|uniref:Type VI secretion system baseplate subunit TssG n=1 Tax=Luteimonas salinisoli TaxID=2752307 RepID=A0A853JGU3_9GAMM|nr:type VI secretion system baseplate subunit TssG [Luteimonas salinisoli]NZA28606.1 type VI secretion system baseplate subunit TssG [Luteimonas salinisoli]